MPNMGCREVYFVNAMQIHQVDFLIDRVKEAVMDMKLPPEYDVRIYRNVYSCCGVGGLGLIIEVAGPEKEKVILIDQRALSRVLEFCEKEGYEVGHHSFEQYESI